ncbi:response regulator [Streptomyces sp. NPDC012600]|uniref:response regulator n=1 Tax=Streptomyces sp. NPDC012600 TaxID=3415005 RepID=UPI003C2F7329
MVRVLVIDDEALVREALRLLVSSFPGFEVSVSHPVGAVDQARRSQADVVLLDLLMPGHDWLELLAGLRALEPAPAVAVLTASEIPGAVGAALRAGACGFLLKDMHPEFLEHSLRALAAGGVICVPPASAEAVAAELMPVGVIEEPALSLDNVTEREREVLTLLALGLQNAEIARQLNIGVTTVKTHVGVLKSKLGVPNRVVLASVAQKAGLA